jgi:hypothetical protein
MALVVSMITPRSHSVVICSFIMATVALVCAFGSDDRFAL